MFCKYLFRSKLQGISVFIRKETAMAIGFENPSFPIKNPDPHFE